ncbi:MAG: hypothetical protein NXI31_21700 [bacterium]|nr:hypothetical protein [bacterium]
MQPMTVLLSSATAGAAAAFLVHLAVSGADPAQATAAPEVDSARLLAITENLESRQREFEQRMAQQLQSASATPMRVAAGPTIDREFVLELVNQALADRQSTEAPDARHRGEGEVDRSKYSATDWYDELRTLQASGESTAELWAQLEACDRLDEVLDVYRTAVEQAPQSTAAHYELACAAHAAAMSRPNHEQGRWWRESDSAYGDVLELDPQHWDARYEKAVKLTFWPSSYGRMPEAIQHFETLIEQQRSLPVEGRHSQVYFQLGNLHAQRGDLKEARSVWQQGLQRHPTASRLQQRLQANSGQ